MLPHRANGPARRPWRRNDVPPRSFQPPPPPMHMYHPYPPPPPYGVTMDPPPQPYAAAPYFGAPAMPAAAHAVELQPVMAANFSAELELIGSLLPRYSYVIIDTEYPGTVHHPPAGRRDADLSSDELYVLLKSNVDDLPLVQLGIALCDAHGNLALVPNYHHGYYHGGYGYYHGGYVERAWEAEFADFDVGRDRYAPQSVAFLRTQGVNFDAARVCGVTSAAFGAKLAEILQRAAGAGVELTWVAFGGAYDLAYLVKILTGGQPLPETRQAFMEQVTELLGGRFFDAKLMAENCGRADLRGVGLRSVGANLGAPTPGANMPWLAGVKSLVAQRVYRILSLHVLSKEAADAFEGSIDGLG